MSVGWVVGWVTHLFDDLHVAPYWPTSDSTFYGGRYEGSYRVAIFLEILLSNLTSLGSLVFKLSLVVLIFPILNRQRLKEER